VTAERGHFALDRLRGGRIHSRRSPQRFPLYCDSIRSRSPCRVAAQQNKRVPKPRGAAVFLRAEYCSHRSDLIAWGAQGRNDGVRACLDGRCVCPYYARLCTAGFLGRGGLNGCPHADAVEHAQCDIRALSLAPRESWVPTAGFYPAMPSQRLESPKGDPVMSNALRTVLPRPQVTATR
jgi:hypothetical protein